MENFIKKEEESIIRKLFIDIMCGRNMSLPKNPKKIFKISEIQKFTGFERLLMQYFTEDAHTMEFEGNFNDTSNVKDLIFFWLYYKIYGFDELIEDCCEKDETNYLFLIDDVFHAFTRNKPCEESVELDLSDLLPNYKNYLEDTNLTQKQICLIIEQLYPYAKELYCEYCDKIAM